MVDLHRIYQGRVYDLEILKDGTWEKVDNPTQALLSYHELFQDAVNYYLLALVSMANDDESSVGKMKKRMDDCWSNFVRNGEFRSGMKYSIARTLGIQDAENLTKEKVCKRILEGNTANPDILQLAVNLIAKKCNGQSGIQQQGPTYLPRLCYEDYSGNWDCDSTSKLAKEGEVKLANTLYSNSSVSSIKKISSEIGLGWAAIKTQPSKYWENDEARQELKEAISHFEQTHEEFKNAKISEYLNSTTGYKTKLKEYKETLETFSDIRFEKNNKADKNRKNGLLLLKFFPDDFTVGLMRCFIPDPNDSKNKNKAQKTSITASEWDSFGDDPIKLSRCDRKYVFKAFTALPIFDFVWKNFDIIALKEALKTLNQFEQKTKEREDRRKEVLSALDWMEGKSGSKLPNADGEYEQSLGVLNDDPRWARLETILNKDLAVSNDLINDDPEFYGLRRRTVRGYEKIFDTWNKILDKEKANPETEIILKLKTALDKYQSEHRDDMGSASLFQSFIKQDNWIIWRHPSDKLKNNWAESIIENALIYYEKKEEVKRLEEPINFTPADTKYSRRLCNLNELVGASFPTKDYKHESDSTISLPLAMKSGNKWSKHTVKMHYGAPRFLRDGLKNGSQNSVYLPPMASSIVNEPDNFDFSTCPVQLMPDWDKNDKCRILLNFPVTVSVGSIQNSIPTAKRFEKQFLFSNNKNSGLLWPETDEKGKAIWFKNRDSFDVLSVDLGQRSAGAAVVIEVSSAKPEAKYRPREIGTVEGVTWYAFRKYASLLRLPGEDAKVLRNGKWQTELSGNKGRNPTAEETKEAIIICNKFGIDNSQEWITDELSFPEQNDKLLVVARRAQTRLARYNRWLWMLSDAKKKDKALEEIKEYHDLNYPEKNLLKSELKRRESLLKEVLKNLLLQITERILPLRGRIWQFIEYSGQSMQKNPTYVLCQTEKGSDKAQKDICGQRGISFARIEQLEELRKRWQSFNRALVRVQGAKPETSKELRNSPVPDPCPDILRRLENMKEDRVNQTAHQILALALGVRFKTQKLPSDIRIERNIHGEYEKIPGRSPVGFIVMEDLSRYLTSQDRAPVENTRLMKWSHRAVLEKIKMLTEVFGIQVVEAQAAYSSKFCSVSGIPGFRAVEVSSKDKVKYPWKKLLEENNSDESKMCAEVFKQLELLPRISTKGREVPQTLLVPKIGGTIFVPIKLSDITTQADINAAFNIGLRAIAAPDKFDVHNRIRAERKGSTWLAVGKSKLDKARFGTNGAIINYTEDAEEKGKKNLNYFVDIAQVAEFGKATFSDEKINKKAGFISTGKGLWTTVKNKQWVRCMELNKRKLAKLSLSKEEIPV